MDFRPGGNLARLTLLVAFAAGCRRTDPAVSVVPSPPVASAPQQPVAAPPAVIKSVAGDGRYAARVRSTFYYAHEARSDPDTDAGRSATGVRLRVATATQIGVCAVDPARIAYGSRVLVPTADGPREYLAADTGGAVKRERASRQTTVVIDFYSPRQVGGDYQDVTIVPYRGAVPFAHLPLAEKRQMLDREPGRPSG